MRVIFITQKQEIHSSIILEQLLKSKDIEIVCVVTSKTLIHKRNLIGSLIYIYKKSGLLYLYMRIFEALYLKFYKFFKAIGWDKFKGEKLTTIADLIKKYKLYHIETGDINNEKSLNVISKLRPDVMVSCVFNQIYEKNLIEAASKGIINIHRAYLPAYRGVSPTFWVLANNENETGISAHLVTSDIDSGPILLQKKVLISKKDTIYSLSKKLMESIKGDFISDLIKYVKNEKRLIKIHEKGVYYSWPDRKAVLRFFKKGKKLI